MKIVRSTLMDKTHEYHLEWAQSIKGWVVKRGEQPVAWFDGEQLDLAEDFVASLHAQEDMERMLATTQAV